MRYSAGRSRPEPGRRYLLGYANADHWTIAIAVSEKTPAASFMFRDDFPRTELVRAALEVVAATLSVSEGN
jgi:hypothetical protein